MYTKIDNSTAEIAIPRNFHMNFVWRQAENHGLGPKFRENDVCKNFEIETF